MQSLGPGLLQDAENALKYAETMVARWLTKGMFKDKSKAKREKLADDSRRTSTTRPTGAMAAASTATRRVRRALSRTWRYQQPLQAAVLSAYHLMTMVFSTTGTTKIFCTDAGNSWTKSLG